MLKEEIKKECLSNTELFNEICTVTGKTPTGCIQFLQRNSSKELKSIDVCNAIKKYTGFTEEQIYEPQKIVA